MQSAVANDGEAFENHIDSVLWFRRLELLLSEILSVDGQNESRYRRVFVVFVHTTLSETLIDRKTRLLSRKLF